VNDLRPHDHVTQTLKELHWLSIAQRIEYRLCLFVGLLKSLIGHVQVYISGLLTAVADLTSRSTRRDATKENFVVLRTRLNLSETAFTVAATQAWNRLPTELLVSK